jgi:hypothetical protein
VTPRRSRRQTGYSLKEIAVAVDMAPATLSVRLRRGHSLGEALRMPVAMAHSEDLCFGVGERAGKCGEPTINPRYCAKCMPIMQRWVDEVRA